MSRTESLLMRDKTVTKLTEIYTIKSSEEITNFIETNESEKHKVINLLKEIQKNIRNYFVSEELFLEVLTDPETDSEQRLAIIIETTLPAKQALKKLDDFDRGWWLNAFEQNKQLSIHLEFV